MHTAPPLRGWARRRLPLLLVLAVGLAACGSSRVTGGTAGAAPPGLSPADGSAFPVTVTDDDGVAVTLSKAPRRIVTFAPSDTEILFAIGEGAKVVGVSGSYDDYPPAARGLPHVGGESGVEPNVEAVVALRPDLVVTFAGSQEWKVRLRSLGIPVFSIDSTSLDDLFGDIERVGRITGAQTQAAGLVSQMRARDERIERAVGSLGRVSCFFEVTFPPLATVGPGSFIYDLLQRAGCDPVTSGASSAYPVWSVDELVREDPAVYLVGSAPGVSVAAVGHRPGYAALTAVKSGRVVVVDSNLVTRNGPRMIDGLDALAAALHPGAFAA